MLEFAISVMGLLTAIFSGVAALLTFWITSRQISRNRREASEAETGGAPPPARRRPPTGLLLFLGGLFTGITAVIVVVRVMTPNVDVTITDPPDGGRIAIMIEPNGSGQFHVHGTSSGVAGNRRLYVLVHPERKFAPGWWIQQEPSVLPNGDWSLTCWVGTAGSEAAASDEVWVAAIVGRRLERLPVGPDRQPWVPHPQDLEPMSDLVITRLTVGTVKRVGS